MKNSKRSGNFSISLRKWRIDCGLPEQIQNNINWFKRIDKGTKSKLSTECRLARGNPQVPGIVNLFSQPKLSRINFMLDLKAHSKTPRKESPNSVRKFTKFRGKNMLEYELQTG